MNGFIYKITNQINGKVYIGKTLHSSVEERFKEHCKDAFRKRNEKRPLYSAIQKYGINNFIIEEIESSDISILSEREQYWIKYYSAYEKGYNATRGGEGKQLYNYDDIIKQFQTGKLINELAKEFDCCTDTICQALQLAGIESTTNAYNRLKKALLAKDLNGNIIREFDSRREAAEWLIKNNYTKSKNIDNINATIGRVANGKRKSAYGLIWINI